MQKYCHLIFTDKKNYGLSPHNVGVCALESEIYI